MLKNIEINCHSSIKINTDKIIYIDPFKIQSESHDADIILITHDHYDHYSPEDIEKILNDKTVIVAPKTMEELIDMKKVILVEPEKVYNIEGIKIETVLAYNVNKQFHLKEKNWLGYIIEINIAGTGIFGTKSTACTCYTAALLCNTALCINSDIAGRFYI